MEKQNALDVSALADKQALLALLLEEEGLLEPEKQAIVPRQTAESPPLSFAQQRLWFLDQLVPDSSVYHVPELIRLKGQVDVALLEYSLNEIIRRHEALRTTFPESGGKPLQVIVPSLILSLAVIDLHKLAKREEREALVQQLARAEARRPFDLRAGPLIRAALLRIAEREHMLLLDMHHIICDGWSLGILFSEMTALYDAYRKGQPSPLPPLPIQYADYALWQREWLKKQVEEEQLRYWRQQLKYAPTLLELPADAPRPLQQTFQGAMEMFTLPGSLVRKIKQLAQQTETTLFMLLLATFNVLLSRYTGQTNLVVGTPIANRRRPEIEKLIGFFVNTLPMHINLAGNPTFRELLEQVKEVALGAYAHQDLPFERLVEELQPERSLSHTPLVQVLLAVQNARMEPQQIPGLILQMETFDEGVAPFDLSIFFTEQGEALRVDLVYSTDLFKRASIKRMAQHLHTLLESVVASPQQHIARLPLLSEAEREHLLYTWNQSRLDVSGEHYPHRLFEKQAALTPDTIALTSGDVSLTYGELDDRANQLAHYLQRWRVGPDILVGLCVERSLEMVIGLLGILKAGGAYVPFDPDYPHERLAFMLRDIQTPILVTQESLRERLAVHNTRIICLDSDQERLAKEPAEALPMGVQLANLGYVIYTSGSTGWPKGVAMCLHTLTNLLFWQQTADPGAARTLQFALLSFDVSFQEIFATLSSGGTLVVASQAQRRDSEALLKLLCEQSIERIFVPFVALQSLAEEMEQADSFPASLREIYTAGEQLRLTQPIRHLLSRLDGCRLHNHYGPSESHVVTTYTLPTPVEQCVTLPPIGRPIANTAIYVLDTDLQPTPIGVTGELYIGGEMPLARGYLHRPDLTAERFWPDPFGARPGGRLYKTGDLARYLADGNIEFLGRADFQVKVRGYRIEPGEIEAILEQHSAILKAVVMVREDQAGEKQLVAYITTGSEQGPLNNELRRYLLEHLPAYMLPSHFVLLKQWPLTPSGKIDRRMLPAPGSDNWTGQEAVFVAPRDPIEEALMDIWGQILGRQRIGIHHNFFESGGHSLLATQVLSRVRSTFQIELPLQTLFEAPTIAEFGECIHKAARGEQSRRIPQPQVGVRDGNLPMSFAQQRMWVLHQLMPDNPAYNMSGGLHLSGLLAPAVLERSLNEIVRRHEALRTAFDMQQSQPVQIILSTLHVPLLMVDLQSIAGTEQKALLQQLVTEEARRSFDLRHGPLIHITLIRLSPQEHALLLNMHHIVCDGWSLGVFFRELTLLYEAFLRGEGSPLPPLLLQYADYALWQHQWVQGELLEAQLAYWRQALAGLQPLELPTDYPRSPIQVLRGAVQKVHLPHALSQDLKMFSQREGVTLFMLLLAGFQVLLARYSNQEDIAVGTPIANRNRTESENLIGCFVNTLVLRSDLSGNPSFQEFLRRVREVCLGAYAHQDLPFERIVDTLQPHRDMSRSPLFQVLFALHNQPSVEEALTGLRIQPMEVELETVKFELSLTLSETAEGLVGNLRYCTDLFAEATMERMVRHWQCLLEWVIAHPQARLAELPLLTKEEEQQVLSMWNATQEDYTLVGSLSSHFEEQVKRSPDAVALVSEEGSLTYSALNWRANKLAHSLRGQGIGREQRVGLLMEASLDLLIGLLGTLKAGGTYVPLDPGTPPERLDFLLLDAAISVLLTHPLAVEPGESPVTLKAGKEVQVSILPQQAAYVMYTSGSTGRPKGVVVEHRQALNYAEAIKRRVKLTAGARYGLLQPLTVDSSLTMLWGALLTGGRLLLIKKERGLDPEELATTFEREPIDYLKIAPSHLAALLAGASPERLLPHRAIIIGGEASHWQWASTIAAHMPEGRMYNHYGPTEATVGVLTYQIGAGEQAGGEPGVLTPLGKPLGKSRVYILDGWMRPVPVAVFGELYIGGEQVARGYLGRPDFTAECFVPDPYGGEPGARLYRTGDLARYRVNGDVEFLGRQDEQVKIRGYRVEPGEVEAVINQHPRVQETLVVARETPAGEKHLVAYVLMKKEDGPLVSQDIRGFVRERLPEYMVPTAVVALQHWPRTVHGKIDRQALPTPKSTQSLIEEAFVAPQTAVEKVLAELWAEMLGLEQVGIYDNFFTLGGDSILCIKLVSRARQAGLYLTPRQIFQVQHIAGLAALPGIQSEAQAGRGESEAGLVPLTPIQCWFFEKNLSEPHHWNQPVQLKLAAHADETLLEAAIQQVFKHHAILQSHFLQTAQSWQLHLTRDPMRLPWSRINLATLPEEEQAQRLQEEATQLQTSLNLTVGPLGNAAFFDLGQEGGRHLLWVIHHLLVDAVSQGILLEDVQIAYQCLQRGQAPQWPQPTTSFGQWARMLRKYAYSSELQSERTYWLDSCWDSLPAIPVDFPPDEESNREEFARTLEVSLTPEETHLLLHEVPGVYHTHMNDVLLTALVQSFAFWTGESRLLLTLEGHGREDIFEDVDLSRSVGWFTTRFPVLLSLDMPEDRLYRSDPGEDLVAIKEQLRRIPHHGIGYGVLRYLSEDKEAVALLQARPSPQVSFNYFGRQETGTHEQALFEIEQNPWGIVRSPQGERSYWLEINVQVIADRLTLDWTYSERIHHHATIERLASDYLEALRAIIAHCQSASVGSYTPSDFPLAMLDEQKLGELAKLLQQSQREESR